MKKFKDFISDTVAILQSSKVVVQSTDKDLWNVLVETRRDVSSALANDFDTPSAIHKISEYIDVFNLCYVPSDKKNSISNLVDFGLVLASKELVRSFVSIVGLSNDQTISDSTSMECLLTEINQFRSVVRNYALASDEVR